jgi:hypothetical protein
MPADDLKVAEEENPVTASEPLTLLRATGDTPPGMPGVSGAPGAGTPPGRRRPNGRAPRRPRQAPNAFRGAYLARLDERDEPDWSLVVETAGPWKVEPLVIDGEDGFGVFHGWERPGLATPRAWFTTFERARMAAAVLPALGTEPWLTLRMAAGEPIGLHARGGQRVGISSIYDPKLTDALHLTECLMRSPAALAALLLAAGPQAVMLVGAILASDLSGTAGAAGDGAR